MAIIKCKMCGGDLVLTEGSTVAECEYCGTMQTVPVADNEKKLTLFARANRLRYGCEFDKAAGVYEAIVAEFPEEAEAYWGLVLCKYGIEYVDDPATGKKIPTCHRSSFDSVTDDNNYDMTLEYADVVARRVYREEAKTIEQIRKGIIEVSSKEDPYDIFICYKETEIGSSDRTLDSVLAQDVYDALTEKGYRVFFSRITLEDKLGVEYEPYIFAALNSAKIMLAFGTDYEHYNAVWVKNEWSRYLKLMAEDRSKHLIPCYKDIDIEDMPKEFRKLQAQDLGKVGATQDLLRGIAKILPQQGNTVFVTQKPTSSTSAMVMRGQFALDDGDWKKADEYFERALDENPEDAKAYVGKVLVGLRLSEVEQINDRLVKLDGDKNFERAIRFSTGADRGQLQSIKEQADIKWYVKCFTVGLKKVAKQKECQEIINEIKKNTAAATVEGYRKAADLCKDARCRGVGTMFTMSLEDSYKRQSEIMRLLGSSCKEYTVEDIKRSPYFSRAFLSLNVLQDDLKQMIADGCVEQCGHPDSYCAVGVKEKLVLQRNESEYAHALNAMSAAGNYNKFIEAANLFESLGDYLDSAEKAVECRRMGDQIKAEMEADAARHREWRRQELIRQETERKAVEEKRLAEIKAHNEKIIARIALTEKALEAQKAIYTENAGKIFGAGAKLRKTSKAEIVRLESELQDLKKDIVVIS